MTNATEVYSIDELCEMRDMWEEGASVQEIVKKYGCGIHTQKQAIAYLNDVIKIWQEEIDDLDDE